MTKVPQHADAWRAATEVIMPAAKASGARILAISGSQGSGKSTLADLIVDELQRQGLRSAAVSLDDYYLTRAERHALARTVHPLLATRGVPGTHDIAWFRQTIESVLSGATDVTVPRFDKGADDRRGQETLSVDVLIVEGWCLGVPPQEDADLAEPANTLERNEDADLVWRRFVNDAIAQSYLPVWQLMEFWVQLRVPGFGQVLEWRSQQEQSLPAEQRMTASELERFVAHYERCTHALWASPPLSPGVMIDLDEGHRVVSAVPVA